ncbi:MAG: AAA family ATPase [Hyphomicrobiales bacterium]
MTAAAIDGFVLITGVSAAGKSTVAQRLAERLPRAVHVRGDTFRRFVVSGREEMTPGPGPAALTQLELRYRLSAHAGDAYVAAGFTAVVQDVVLGEWLERYIALVASRPLRVFVLDPSVEALRAREAGRPKVAYAGDGWTIEALRDSFHRDTPRIGLWLDTSDDTPDDTVERILGRAEDAIVHPAASFTGEDT